MHTVQSSSDPSSLHASVPEIAGVVDVPLQHEATQQLGLVDGAVQYALHEVISEIPYEEIPAQTGQRRQRRQTVDPQIRKAQLLASLPKDEHKAAILMRGEIETTVKNRLEKLAIDAKSKVLHPYHLANILATIRKFTDILASLFSVTFEYLKTVWLQIVHGLNV